MAELKFSKRPTPNNTFLSDLNELLVCYFINYEKWPERIMETTHNQRCKQVSAEQYIQVRGKARVMAEAFLKWATKNKYKMPVKNVYWTARPNTISKVVKYDVDQRQNPTDVLVQFFDGPTDGFLGMSAKMSKTTRDVGFKNPTMKSIEGKIKAIGISTLAERLINSAVKKLNLPKSPGQRKTEIDSDDAVKQYTKEFADDILMKLRDEFFKSFKKLKPDELSVHLIKDWLNSEQILTPYIKVTGNGNTEPYKASVFDPLENPKVEALLREKIKLEKVGNSAILVTAGSKKIFRMRLKWNNTPLASAIQFSGDPA